MNASQMSSDLPTRIASTEPTPSTGHSRSRLRRSARLANSGSKKAASLSSRIPEQKRKPRRGKKSKDSKFEDVPGLTDIPSKPLYKISSMVFPTRDASSFGLAQEKLADDPFKVLVACVFLTRTKGSVSMPVCREMFRQYPSVESLANADMSDIVTLFQPLGLQNQRAKTVVNLARIWLREPATLGKRYRKLHYPVNKDGLDISPSEQPIQDEIQDPRIAWEIGHLPGVGAYALDSWRIFCRDKLRGIPDGLRNVKTKQGLALERAQEWTRVLPLDKELIAYIRWRWLRLGYLWSPTDGSKIKVDEDLLSKMQDREVLSYKKFDNPWFVYGTQLQKSEIVAS